MRKETDAKRVNQGGMKGNKTYHKEDLSTKHTKSNIDLGDPRVKKIKILVSHPRRNPKPMPQTVEAFELKTVIDKWERDGYTVVIT
jgi:hypothetical protein